MSPAVRERRQVEPPLKWVGGKRQLTDELIRLVPTSELMTFNTYHEPFMGGAALFFALRRMRRPFGALLSDKNERLVRTFAAVRDDVEEVIEELGKYAVFLAKKEERRRRYYNAVRAMRSDELEEHELAAWMIFLNRTCFNGVYRVNRDGRFNVPMGRYENPTICDEEGLRLASLALAGVEIVCGPYAKVHDHSAPFLLDGHLFYLDPPYVPTSDSADFTRYTADGFGAKDQEDLAAWSRSLVKRGATVIASNSNTPLVRRLWKGFEFHEVRRKGTINSKASSRGDVKELIMVGRPS